MTSVIAINARIANHVRPFSLTRRNFDSVWSIVLFVTRQRSQMIENAVRLQTHVVTVRRMKVACSNWKHIEHKVSGSNLWVEMPNAVKRGPSGQQCTDIHTANR